MIVIGGITRLTDSGLSITEWRLLSDIMPPNNIDDWNILFDKYKESPEFKLKNFHMSIYEFKSIFYWEYLHRIWGRIIGITYFLPLLFFWLRKKLKHREKMFHLFLSLVGFFQAFMGWFMVESGLIDKPDVSHFRLSIHLVNGFIIYSLLLFMFWALFRHNIISYPNNTRIELKLKKFVSCLVVLIFITIISGAFVAGTDAGLVYNSFPLMNESFLPPIFDDLTNQTQGYSYFLYDTGFLQFMHRALSTTTLLAIVFSSIYNLRENHNTFFKRMLTFLIFLISAQYILGITTLILYVPIFLGLFHQIGSLLVLSVLIILLAEINKNLKH